MDTDLNLTILTTSADNFITTMRNEWYQHMWGLFNGRLNEYNFGPPEAFDLDFRKAIFSTPTKITCSSDEELNNLKRFVDCFQFVRQLPRQFDIIEQVPGLLDITKCKEVDYFYFSFCYSYRSQFPREVPQIIQRMHPEMPELYPREPEAKNTILPAWRGKRITISWKGQYLLTGIPRQPRNAPQLAQHPPGEAIQGVWSDELSEESLTEMEVDINQLDEEVA